MLEIAQEMEETLHALEGVEKDTDLAWEFNKDAGMMRVGFHPAKGKRRSTYVTKFWSRFTNIHQEETLSRLGVCCVGESLVEQEYLTRGNT